MQCFSNRTSREFTIQVTNSDSPLGLQSAITTALFRLSSPASVANLAYFYNGMLPQPSWAAMSICLFPGMIQGFLLRCDLHTQREVMGRPLWVQYLVYSKMQPTKAKQVVLVPRALKGEPACSISPICTHVVFISSGLACTDAHSSSQLNPNSIYSDLAFGGNGREI